MAVKPRLHIKHLQYVMAADGDNSVFIYNERVMLLTRLRRQIDQAGLCSAETAYARCD